MFSSNSFPQLFTPSIHVFPPLPPPDSFFNLPFHSGDCFLFSDNNVVTPLLLQDFIIRQQQKQGSGLHYCDPLISETSRKKMEAVKKLDGHRKIYTNQGTRERRVRLSIDVARKFFGLQDLLGFDKASKTLDWLFTNSKIAIKELEKTKLKSSSIFTDPLLFMDTTKEGDGDDASKGKKTIKPLIKCVSGKSRKKRTQKCKAEVHNVNLARNLSREKARARARERTREKLRIKKLEDESKKVTNNYCYNVSPSTFILQSNCWNFTQIDEDKIGESNSERKFSKPSSMLYNYQKIQSPI